MHFMTVTWELQVRKMVRTINETPKYFIWKTNNFSLHFVLQKQNHRLLKALILNQTFVGIAERQDA